MKQRSEYLRVARDGWSRSTPGVVVQVLRRRVVLPTGDAGTTGAAAAEEQPQGVRLGITASRKVGNAVARNRARRRLRAAAAIVLPADGMPGCDYVLIGRRDTLTRPFAALLDDLRGAVRRGMPAAGSRRPRPEARPSGGRTVPGRQR